MALSADPVDVAGREDRLAVLSGSGIKIYDATNLTERSALSAPPVKPAAVAPLGTDAVVVVGEDGSLWHGAPQWQQLETPAASKVRALASGRGNTFWALEQSADGSVAVVQYSPEEGRLAEWIAASAGEPVSLAAAVDADYFAAILAGTDTERTVAIRRNAANGWELLADKTITASENFGLTGGKLSAVTGDLHGEITVGLRENPLDPSAPRSLALAASVFAGGTGLVASDGLPLVRVSEDPGFGRLAVVAGPTPGTAQFYQGDGACVEQYSVSNLGEITAFDAGAIEMEGGVEKTPPPEEDPELPTP